MANTVAGILLAGILADRPAANAVSAGTLYAASDTGIVYQSDGVSTWTVWATFAGGQTSAMNVFAFQNFR